MAELVGIDHGADRPHHAAGDVELEHADHPSFGVVQLSSSTRKAIDSESASSPCTS